MQVAQDIVIDVLVTVVVALAPCCKRTRGETCLTRQYMHHSELNMVPLS